MRFKCVRKPPTGKLPPTLLIHVMVHKLMMMCSDRRSAYRSINNPLEDMDCFDYQLYRACGYWRIALPYPYNSVVHSLRLCRIR